MDISDSLSTNSVELDETMGSILSASNENETQNTETEPPENIAADESNLTSQNIEVNELQNVIETNNLSDTADNDVIDNVTSYTDTLSDQDINLIIMGKSSTSIDDSDEIISSSEKCNPSTSQIEENEELWLGDNTRQLVKVDTDEDFEVIVKSLETAIVETERYDIETGITTSEEPVISNSENSLGLSIIEADGHSILEDIPSDLLTSTVPPLPLQEISENEAVEISLEIPDSPDDIIQHRSIDTYEEFAAISEPTVESLDEQSNSLFEVLEPEIDLPVDDEPSLLEIQEATMPTDISEEFVCKEIEEEIMTTQENELEICEGRIHLEAAEEPSVQKSILSDISNIVEESTATVLKSSEMVTESSEIVEEPSEIVEESPTPVSESSALVAESPTPVAESLTPVAQLLAADTDSSELITELPVLTTESPLPSVESSTIVTESFEVIAESSAQVMISPEAAIIAESVTESLEFIAELPTAIAAVEPLAVFANSATIVPESPEIVADSPVPVTESSEVIGVSPAPVADLLAAATVIESPELNAESLLPVTELSEIIAEPSHPVLEKSELIEQSSALVEDSPTAKTITELPELIVESPKQVTEKSELTEQLSALIEDSPKETTVAELPESVAETPSKVGNSSEPILESLTSVVESPTLFAEHYAPVEELPVPVTELPTPAIELSEHVAESSEPIVESTILVVESTTQNAESPTPVTKSPAPFEETHALELPELITKSRTPGAESPALVTESTTAIIIESPTSVIESTTPIIESPTPIIKSPTPIIESPMTNIESPTPIPESPTPIIESPTPIIESPTPLIESPPPIAVSPTLVAESAALVELPAPVEESLMEIHKNITPIQEEKELIFSETEIKDNEREIQISKTAIINELNRTKESKSTLDNDNLIVVKEIASKIDEATESSKNIIITDNIDENMLEVNATKDTNVEILEEQLDCKNEVEEIKEIKFVDDNNLQITTIEDTTVEIFKDQSDIRNVGKEVKEKKIRDDISQFKDDQLARKDKIEEIDKTNIEENIQVNTDEQLDSIIEEKVQESDLEDITVKSQQTDEVCSTEISNKQEFIKSTEKNIINTEESNSEQNKTLLEFCLSDKDTSNLSKDDIKLSDKNKITSEEVAKVESQQSENVVLSNKEEPLLLKSDTSCSKSLKHSLEFDEKEQCPPKKIKLVREKFQSKPPKSEVKNLPKNIEIVDDQKMKLIPESIEKEKKLGTQEEIIITCQVEKSVTEDKETIEQILEKLEDPSEKSESKSPAKAQKLKLQRNYKLPQKSPKQEKTSLVNKIVLEAKIANTIEIKSNKPEPIIKLADKTMTTEQVTADDRKITDNLQDKPAEKNKSAVESTISTAEQESAITDDNKFKDEIKSVQTVKEIKIEQSVKQVSSSEICISNIIVDQEKIRSVNEVQVHMDTSSTVDKLDDKELKDIQEVVDFSNDIEDATEDNKISVEIPSNVVLESVTVEEQIDLEEHKKIIDTDNKERDVNKSEIEELSKMEQEDQNLADEIPSNIVLESVTVEEQIDLEEHKKIIDTDNKELDTNKSEIEERSKMEQEEQNLAIESIKNMEVHEIEEDIANIVNNQDENKFSDIFFTGDTTSVATVHEKTEVLEESSQIEESSDEDDLPEMLETEEEELIVESLKKPEVAVKSIVTTTEFNSDKMECTSMENKKLEENTEEESIAHVPKIPEIQKSVEKKVDTKEIIKTAKSKISTKVVETLETENIISLEQSKDNFGKIEANETMIEKETDNIISTKSIEETQVSMATQKLIEIMQKEDIEEMQDDVEKTKHVETKDEIDKAEPTTKNESLLTINTEYPLLSSRLREKLEPKRQKLTDEVKITSVSLPKVPQESISKKLQGELSITKEEVRTIATSSLLAQNPEITLTKELRSSASDHSATMESATKIKITKRKLATPEPTVRSVTKPLSVQIDDVEGSNDQRSHSYGGSGQKEHENIPKLVIKSFHRSEGRSSPKITIKPIKPPEDIKSREESSHSPKITIKPIVKPDPLKITITKQKTDDTHSILKIYQPEDSQLEQHVPKLTFKPIPKNDDMQHSPRITIKAVKPSSMSPKITVKPISSSNVDIHSPKGAAKSEESYPKVTIKPVLRPEETHRVSQLSPRQIKLKSMTFESTSGVTVEPVTTQKLDPEIQTSPLKISVKSFAKMEESLSPKLTIKPITKTCEIVQSEDGTSNPLKLTIKPILKPEETSYQSPKITIKPIVKPDEQEESDKPERIILKIQKNNLPSPKERKESRKEPEVKIEAIPHDLEKFQKLDKIKLKLTKEGSHAQIIPSISTITTDGTFSLKRSFGISDSGVVEKRSKSEFSGTEILHTSDISINIVEPNAKPCPKSISEEVTIMKIDKASGSREYVSEQQISQSKFKEMLMKIQQKPDITCTPHIEADDYSSSSDDVKIVEVIESDPLKDPLSLQDDSNSQDIMIVNEVINTNPFQNIKIINAHTIEQSTPKKRGRPRKNPLEVKPEIKGEDCIEVRPKRTCRAPPGRTPFAVKERKPRGAGRARGSSRGRGASKSPQKSPKETKTTPRGKALKEAKALAKIEAARLAQEVVIDEITIEDSTNDTPAATPIPPAEDSPKKPEVKCPSPSPLPQMIEPEVKIINEEVLKQPPPAAVYEEETRMSADNSSRAQTPARQVFTAPLPEGPEESQSSVQSTATTESSKTKKGRLEVIDPDSAVTTVEQIVEYSWANGGPYMLQEQIAQFLGVKSFKRKYPGLTRRPVEMQERDYIREKGLVHESMCDMGLTAVPSSEILDIMYSDFQEKYEEYRKCLRDKQAKEISNKQKAVSLATSQEKNKIDFKERAIRSAASWNLNFNKARKDGRKCCMDLQTFTINYPAGKIKVPQKTPVGHYPLALVPGQYTDYFKSYTPNELNYLPLNTVRYGPVLPNQLCDPGQSDGSQSDSDSSSGSDSDSSDDSMSTEEEAVVLKSVEVNLTQLMTTPKSKVH